MAARRGGQNGQRRSQRKQGSNRTAYHGEMPRLDETARLISEPCAGVSIDDTANPYYKWQRIAGTRISIESCRILAQACFASAQKPVGNAPRRSCRFELPGPVGSATPKPTGLLNGEGLLNRDSESFGARFRGPKPTLVVGSGPRSASLEAESAGAAGGSSQTLAAKGQKGETPGRRSLGVGRQLAGRSGFATGEIAPRIELETATKELTTVKDEAIAASPSGTQTSPQPLLGGGQPNLFYLVLKGLPVFF